jgi:Mrp family chromosome partitioning ATPase
MGESPNTALHHRLQEMIHYSELKQLAYNVAAQQQEKAFHSLAVLSFYPAEGKTLFCAAMAMVYAETCRTKVLVVDTTTFQNQGSLVLKECFNGSTPDVHVTTLEELRRAPAGAGPSPTAARPEIGPALKPEVVRDRTVSVKIPKDNDFSLIKKVSEDRGKQYGLILLDTAPLAAKNRSNVDPLLVARLSEASVLVVSRHLLTAPKLSATLKELEDPTLHLIGLVSNEAYTR